MCARVAAGGSSHTVNGASAVAGRQRAETEDEVLGRQLRTLGMHLVQTRPDGDCLFSAVADQATRVGLAQVVGGVVTVSQLRAAAAEAMRSTPEDYAPFLADVELEEWASTIEHTREWGGQLELRALADSLGSSIVVHSAGEPPMRILGPNHRNRLSAVGDGRGSGRPELHVSYHREQFLLGEHYNSVVLGPGDDGAGDDDADGNNGCGGWTTVG